MELKPCPFCGAKVLGPCGADYYGAFYIIKHKKNCFFKTIFGQHETRIRERSGKINVWDTRATDPLLKEMAEALSQIVEEVKKHAYNPSLEHTGPLVLDSESVLQKYHEQEEK